MIILINHETLFAMALQIKEPMYVKRIEFNKDLGELHIHIDFRKGSKFFCAICGTSGVNVHDTIEKTWRHMNFFQYKAYIHYRTPRVNCPEDGIHLVDIPWASPGSGFTLLFEALILQLAQCMAVLQIANLVDEHDTVLWRIIQRYVNQAQAAANYSDVRHVGVDETATKRGHNYVTLFVDMEQAKVIHATEGKDAATIKNFKDSLPHHHAQPSQITDICADMSPAFRKGIQENFPCARLTFDKFHVLKLVNEAVDQVRRQEQKNVSDLKSSRYLWLYNPENLSETKIKRLNTLTQMNLKTAKAYRMKLVLQDIYKTATGRIDAMNKLQKWYQWAVRCRLQPMKEFAKTLKHNWAGILNYFDSRLTNAILEGTNSIVQSARTRAKGYRNVNNFIAIIYLLAGKLTFNFQKTDASNCHFD
jgi:transposase